MTTMLKLLRNICIWMCSTSCLFGYVTHAVPLEYFDDHEFSYDMDTAQSKVKYDPRLLSQQLKDQHNHPQERAAPCYSATNKYTHGQRVSREDPCEVCLCVDGEIFCWWKKCGSPKRRKFKLEKNTKLGKSKKDKTTIDRINKEQLHKEQLHLKQKKQLEKKLKQQHWQEQQHQLQQQHSGARSKILTFPENLPSVLYYDYKTEDQHGFQHGNHEKPPASPADGSGAGGRTNAHTSISGSSREDDDNNDNDDNGGGEDDDDASSAVGVVQPTSAEMKFGVKSHSATEASKKYSLLQTSTARITTTTTTTTTKAAVAAEAAAAALQPFPNDYTKEDGLNANNQFISGHPVGGMQMLNIDGIRHHTTEQTKNHTTTQGETTFMLSQSQEVDHDDGILRGTGGGNGGSVSTHGSKYSTLHNSDNNKQNNEQLKGGATSFRSSFNDFSSEFNASAAVDLDLIIGHHSAHDAPIILEADSIANASSSSSTSSLLAKHETGDSAGSANTNNNSNRYNLVLSTTMVTSTSVNQDQECIVMGSSYKIGAILPQETGNCLQCICIEGATKDDTPRVTCSPHNCPPLVLPDLFDATGY